MAKIDLVRLGIAVKGRGNDMSVRDRLRLAKMQEHRLNVYNRDHGIAPMPKEKAKR